MALPFRYRLHHLLLLTAAIAIWFALFRFGGVVQLLLLLLTSIGIGPLLRIIGKETNQIWLEITGLILTICSPLLFIGAWALTEMLSD